MKKSRIIFGVSLLIAVMATAAWMNFSSAGDESATGETDAEWAMNATIIEACSCNMFCQCYFNGEPTAHAGHGGSDGMEHFCRFNMAFQINRGSYQGVELDRARFWLAGDLGGDFSQGKTEWAEITFDPSVTAEQREGIATILGHVYPVEWASFTIGNDAPVLWEATKDHARGLLDDGKAGEVVLNRYAGMSEEPVVISNLKYWGAPRNEGFVLMPNEMEAYRVGEKTFEFMDSNGFMITFDINSNDVSDEGSE